MIEKQSLSQFQIGYLRGRLHNRIHEAVLESFVKANDDGLTIAEIARRLDLSEEKIRDWLGAPGDWTLDTVSDLLSAMNAEMYFSTGETQSTQEIREK